MILRSENRYRIVYDIRSAGLYKMHFTKTKLMAMAYARAMAAKYGYAEVTLCIEPYTNWQLTRKENGKIECIEM